MLYHVMIRSQHLVTVNNAMDSVEPRTSTPELRRFETFRLQAHEQRSVGSLYKEGLCNLYRLIPYPETRNSGCVSPYTRLVLVTHQ